MLFSSAFCFGANVLLAGNDDDREPSVVTLDAREADALPVTFAPVPELRRN